MATYFSDSNNPRDAATMLYLSEQLPTLYSEAPVITENTMMYMNYSSSYGPYSDALAANSQNIELPSVGASGSSEHAFNGWRDGGNEMLHMHHQMGGSGSTSILHSGQNLQGQGLSLSLSTQIPPVMQMPSIQFQNPNLALSFYNPNPLISSDVNSLDRQSRYEEHFPIGFHRANQDHVKANPSTFGMSSFPRNFPNSKYLKATQQLLDEVVNVQKALKQSDSDKNKNKIETLMKDSKDNDTESKNESATGNSSNHQDLLESSSSELAPAERLELQNKMTKLLSMENEIDRRYKQYYQQMQIVISSFDVIAGYGSAKPYTALALETISRHFRCLRDAITEQIQATRKSLGEQDTSANSKSVGISRLRYVDQHLKQQKALQQLGMMQQHTWRPQRGLPERSVSVLRAWLFEHFLHPYPKDSDKIMLARRTGLTRSQVSNWFINARVRLWKPMVEEMYKEEGGEVDMDVNSSSENVSKIRKAVIMESDQIEGDWQQSPTSSATKKYSTGQFIQEMEAQPPVEQNVTDHSTMKFNCDQRSSFGDCNLFNSQVIQSGGGVSLTLGLHHFEESNLPKAVGSHNSFVTLGGGRIYNPASSSVGPETDDFDRLESWNGQHRFNNSSHLLHDFVA